MAVSKKTSPSPFDFVKGISSLTADPVADGTLDISFYDSFMINRSLSFRSDCIDIVNLLNRYPNMKKLRQYEILKYLVPKRRLRNDEYYVKQKVDENINVLMKYFGTGYNKALEYSKVISEDDLQKIKEIVKEM